MSPAAVETTVGEATVPDSAARRVPLPAAVYGGGGLIPFVATAIAAWMIEPVLSPWAVFAQLAYGTAILSFLGAAHWGLALAGQGAGGDSRAASTWRRLGLSVLPAVVAWASLLVAMAPQFQVWALLLQIGAFVALFFGDLRAVRLGLAPVWYPRLRKPLTIVVVLALAVSLARIVTL
jgi:hypothetical protein